jgi:very-short-patch-repair endonuclease
MTQLEFISRQLSRAENKTFEHYVVTRIWHLLNDTEIKFVTQQYVKRPTGIALTDMFFPQLKVHIEIDEVHHKLQVEADKVREADILSALNHKIIRIDVTQSLKGINNAIDSIVAELKEIKKTLKDFNPWDFDAEQAPITYIKRGYIDLIDDVAFKTMVDAANCFGNNYKPKGIWKGAAKNLKDFKTFIWFPKLYPNNEWNNSISDDEQTIREYCEIESKRNNHIQLAIKDAAYSRIVFARVRSPLGDVMYRFKGEYKLDIEETNKSNEVVLRRTKTRVDTFSQPL